GQSVLVVSHKATLRLVLSSLLGFDERGSRDRLDQSPACLNIVDFRDPVRARLMLFNDTSHYDERARVPEANLSKWWDSVLTATSGRPRGSSGRRSAFSRSGTGRPRHPPPSPPWPRPQGCHVPRSRSMRCMGAPSAVWHISA